MFTKNIIKYIIPRKYAIRLSSSSPEPVSSSPRLTAVTEEYLKDLPLLQFPGKFCVIFGAADEEKFQNEIDQICQADVVGFDTETKPNYYTNHTQATSLVQLSTDDLCILWRLRRFSNMTDRVGTWVSPTLTNILMCPDILKVGHATTCDVMSLLKTYHLETYNMMDTLHMANCCQMEQLSLRALVALFLQHSLSNTECTSNWNRFMLRKDQILYASTDAWASLRVYRALLKHMEETGVSCPPPIRRAWSLLKPCDQQLILNKLSEKNKSTETGHEGGPPDGKGISSSSSSSSTSTNNSHTTTHNYGRNYHVTTCSSNSENNRVEGGRPVYVRQEYVRKITHKWYQHKKGHQFIANNGGYEMNNKNKEELLSSQENNNTNSDNNNNNNNDN